MTPRPMAPPGESDAPARPQATAEALRRTRPIANVLEALIFDPGKARDERAQLRGRMAEYAVVAAAVTFLAAYEWLRALIDLPQSPLWITFFAVLIVAYCAVRVTLLRPKLLAASMDGRTWEAFRQDFGGLGEHGYLFFASPADESGSSLGPVLVGPTGVYSICFRSNRPTGRLLEKVEAVDGDTLHVGGRPALGNPLGLARAMAGRLAHWLAAHGYDDVPVQAVLLYPGWTIGKQLPEAERDVLLANEKTFSVEVQSGPTQIQPRCLIGLGELLAQASPRTPRPGAP